MLETRAPLNVWIFAADLGRSRRFYEETLGLPLWREEPGRSLHFGLAGGLLTVRARGGERRETNGVSVLVTLGRELDPICASLSARGVAFEEPLEDREFGRSAMLRDPDGYEIWLVRPSATETQFLRWRLTDRSQARRIPVNRKVAPRRHVRPPPPAKRPRHPRV